jgi:large subunit ribosomal protein L21
MFAIFENGSRQYRVKTGDKVKIDFSKTAKAGESLTFDRVLAAGTDSTGKIGQPTITGAVVEAEIIDPKVRARKIEVGKFRRRKGHIRHNGHTQKYTAVRITAIKVPGLAE